MLLEKQSRQPASSVTLCCRERERERERVRKRENKLGSERKRERRLLSFSAIN